MGRVFISLAVDVNQPQVLTVETHEEGLGQSDGHVVLSTVQLHSCSCSWKQDNVIKELDFNSS